jgi:hypothetical protein
VKILINRKITNRCFPHNFLLLHRRSQQKGFFIGSYCIASTHDVDLLDCPQRHSRIDCLSHGGHGPL